MQRSMENVKGIIEGMAASSFIYVLLEEIKRPLGAEYDRDSIIE